METDSSRFVTARIRDLHPTQVTVGLIAVKAKVAKWKQMPAGKRRDHLESHWFPAVKGPDDGYHITDRHHTGLALLRAGVKKARLVVLKDFSDLEPDAFWMAMDHHNWVHPYDAKGKRADFSAIPDKLEDLADDPYRSLADHVQKIGGYADSTLPYAEFLWADFFRNRLHVQTTKAGWENATAAAVALARDSDARCLPGWCGAHGPVDEKRD
jgi:hypothetical protein